MTIEKFQRMIAEGKPLEGDEMIRFSHLAFELDGENTANEWLGPVNDDEYMKLDNKILE